MSDEVLKNFVLANRSELSRQTNDCHIDPSEMYAGPSNVSTSNNVDFYISSLTYETNLASGSSGETSNNFSPQFRRESNSNPTVCPQCKEKLLVDIPLSYFEFYYDMSILLCSNSKCDYPFGTPGEKLLVKYNNSMLEMLKNFPSFDGDPHLELSQLSDLENVYINPLLNSLKKLYTDFEKLKRGDYSSDVDEVQKTNCVEKEGHQISSDAVLIAETKPCLTNEEYKADTLSNVPKKEVETYVVDTKKDLDYIRELLQHFD